MSRAKIAISLDQHTLVRLDRLVQARIFPSRSRAVEAAVEEKIVRLEKGRLARECARLDRRAERTLAEEGLSQDVGEWPAY